MSCIIDFAENSSYTTNVLNGFDIVGLESSETMLQKDVEEEGIANGSYSDLMENSTSFDFINSEIEEQTTFSLEGNETTENAEPIEGSDNGELIGQAVTEDGFNLEFFNNGVNIIGNFAEGEGSVFIQGVNNDAEIEYDELSGKLSVGGQEIAKIDPISDFSNNNYEIF
jgi:hypothetical protein